MVILCREYNRMQFSAPSSSATTQPVEREICGAFVGVGGSGNTWNSASDPGNRKQSSRRKERGQNGEVGAGFSHYKTQVGHGHRRLAIDVTAG